MDCRRRCCYMVRSFFQPTTNLFSRLGRWEGSNTHLLWMSPDLIEVLRWNMLATTEEYILLLQFPHGKCCERRSYSLQVD